MNLLQGLQKWPVERMKTCQSEIEHLNRLGNLTSSNQLDTKIIQQAILVL
jgi:hypothetical protein